MRLIIIISLILFVQTLFAQTYHERRDWFVGRYEGLYNWSSSGDTSVNSWWPETFEIIYGNDSIVRTVNTAWSTYYKVCEDSVMMYKNTPTCDSANYHFTNDFGDGDYVSGFAKIYADSTIDYWYWSPPAYDDGWVYFKGKMVESYASGVGDLQTQKSVIKVFPNPSSDKVIIQSYHGEIESFELFSISGKMILEKSIISLQAEIDISNIESGLYFYRIKTDNNKYKNGKLIIE